MGSNSVTVTVAITDSAGVTLSLTSSHPTVANVPSSVVVPAGATGVGFPIRTSRVPTTTAAAIQAAASGKAVSAPLTVMRR